MYPIKVGELFANVFNPRLLVIPYINLDDINMTWIIRPVRNPELKNRLTFPLGMVCNPSAVHLCQLTTVKNTQGYVERTTTVNHRPRIEHVRTWKK